MGGREDPGIVLSPIVTRPVFRTCPHSRDSSRYLQDEDRISIYPVPVDSAVRAMPIAAPRHDQPRAGFGRALF